MKVFFDTEFTGLHQYTTLISIGLVTEYRQEFYGEFTDFDETQIDDWLRNNVLENLLPSSVSELSLPDYIYVGDSNFIKEALLKWFAQFDEVELWSDCLSYDWVLLSELIADRLSGYPVFPDNFLYHSPYDILTLMKIKGVGLNITREEFTGLDDRWPKHNALWDAKVIKACYEKLMRM